MVFVKFPLFHGTIKPGM